MSANNHAGDLSASVCYALETTRAVADYPFHSEVIIRVDAAESHAFERAKRIVKSDGTTWKTKALRNKISRQLGEAADRTYPQCTAPVDPRW
jgi:hypothetical protein